ncbi:MAG: hypothetical protein ACPG6R_10990 [Aequoribacter sp.]|uniref:hypothetical protein n=1 Tax=Aequoribacter sp. TaxID=2847771 RepID=UPI003C49206A
MENGKPKFRIVVEGGDMDGDGKVGITAKVFLDVPFDGRDELRPMLSTPELEPNIEELPELIAKLGAMVQPILRFVKK